MPLIFGQLQPNRLQIYNLYIDIQYFFLLFLGLRFFLFKYLFLSLIYKRVFFIKFYWRDPKLFFLNFFLFFYAPIQLPIQAIAFLVF